MAYIKREILIEALGKNSVIDKVTYSDGKTIREKIMELPTADVVEVVRCSQCVHCNKDGFCFKNINGIGYKKVLPTDFCNYGK